VNHQISHLHPNMNVGYGLTVLLVGMVYIQKSQMVPINVAKSSLRLISSLLSLPRPEEAIGY
jgi:hypothetical protein